MPTPEECDIAFNLFRDQADAFAASFYDPAIGDRYTLLTRRIVALLTEGHGLPLDDPAHPVQRFGHPDHDEGSFLRLHQQLCEDFQGSSVKPLLIAFFHSTGFYREEMDILLDAFDEYANVCLGLPDSDEDDEGEATDPNTQG